MPKSLPFLPSVPRFRHHFQGLRAMKTLLSFLALVLALSSRAPAQAAADTAAIKQAALDYIDGYYTANADRMTKAVSGDLAKRIVIRNRQGWREFVQGMGATQLIEGTRAGGGSQT